VVKVRVKLGVKVGEGVRVGRSVGVSVGEEVKVGDGVRVGWPVIDGVGVSVAWSVGVAVVTEVGEGVIVEPVTVKKIEEKTPHLSSLFLPWTSRRWRPLGRLPVSTDATASAMPPPNLPLIGKPAPSSEGTSTL
jgi:hypothetical protein